MPKKVDAADDNAAAAEKSPKKARVNAAKKDAAKVVKAVVAANTKSSLAPQEAKSSPVVQTKTDVGMASTASSEASSKGSSGAHKLGGVMNDKYSRGLLVRWASVVVGVLVVVVIVFGVLIYGYKSDAAAVKAVAQIVPYPVEMVNGHFVSYKDYLFEVDANETAYQNNAKLNNQPAVDFSSASGKKLVQQIQQHVIQQLEAEALVAQLASKNGVTVTDSQVNGVVQQLASRNGGEDTLLKVLKQTYGWSLGDLKSVVYKELLQQNLQTKLTSAPSVQALALSKAQDVLKQVNAGGDFSTLAKKYSQASDASTGGDLGYVNVDQLPSQEQSIAQSLAIGSVSGVIKTQYGYDIIKVLDKRSDGTIHVQHILIETLDFNQYFQGQLNQAKLTTYIKV